MGARILGVLAAAFLVGTWLSLREARRLALDEDRLVTVILVVLVSSVIGARALYVLEHVQEFRREWGSALAVWQGGLTLYGGVVAGTVAGLLAARQLSLPMWTVADAVTPAFAIGTVLGRIGCFLNGCCYGVPWNGPWAVIFPRESFAFEDQVASGLIPSTAVHSLPVHPVQLYSMAIMVGVSAYLALAFLRPHREGAIFFRLLIAYGMLRLIVAPFRTEVLASMKTFSVLFIAVGALGLLARQKAPTVAPVARSA